MTREERIEAGARALGGEWFADRHDQWGDGTSEVIASNYVGQTDKMQRFYRSQASLAYDAIFPTELAAGTHWIAPNVATGRMENAGIWERVVEHEGGTVSMRNDPDDIAAIYAAMRTAYLTSPTSGEGKP